MKKILVVALALVVVMSFSATKADAADYGTWLFLKYLKTIDYGEVHHNMFTGTSKTTPSTATGPAGRETQMTQASRDNGAVAKEKAVSVKDVNRMPARKSYLNRR